MYDANPLISQLRAASLGREHDVFASLPDGSTVKSLSREQDGWHLLTSKNSVLKLVN